MTFSHGLRAPILVLILVAALAPSGLAAQQSGLSVTVNLAEYNGSGISGTAYLVETTDGGTHVSMELRGQGLAGNHPTHIHTGTCADFDPNPLYPLTTVNLSPVNKEGVSDSNVPGVTLASLRDGEFVVLVHRSPEKVTEYLVCGEIGSGTVGQAAKVAPAEGSAVAHHMPKAGGGPIDDSIANLSSVMVAMSAAFITAAAGIAIRTRGHGWR